jgi:hypothetical protein
MMKASRSLRHLVGRMGFLGMALGIFGCTEQGGAPLDPKASPEYSAGSTLSVDYNSSDQADYANKWVNLYGPLSLDAGGTLDVSDGRFTVGASPFRIGADYSVYDHLKYIGISTQEFTVPDHGSLTFSVEITATTPGTIANRTIRGCYGAPGSFQNVSDPCDRPWSARALQGQQAGVVLNMINFQTGQLFDWFVSGNEVFALIERLPSNVTNPTLQPGDPGYVGLDKAYTQIIKTQKIPANRTFLVAIRYSRGPKISTVEYFLDGKLFAKVENVGLPLDIQGQQYTGIYPAYGGGERLKDDLDSFVIGHGLFSLLDAFPFQHPERPDLSVSIPMSERLFGQGATGTFANFRVVQVDYD